MARSSSVDGGRGGTTAAPVRLKDVALEAGVSVATVSMVLNQPHAVDRIGEQCARRVRDVAARLGYVPNHHAQAMRGRRTGVIGLALDFGFPQFQNHLATGYFGTLVGGVDETVRQAGQSLMIINPMGNATAPEHGVLALRRRQIDGLIIAGVTRAVQRSPVCLAPPSDLPIIVVEHRGATELPVVSFDERAGIDLAVQHLADLGHRRLLWLGPELDESPGAAVAREHHFMRSVWDRGLRAVSRRYPSVVETVDPEASTVEWAAAALRAFWTESRAREAVTAIACYNDLTAMGAYAAAAEAGLRVPRDVSVTGFDDVQARLLVPALTSVSHMLVEMGQRSVELLLQMVEDRDRTAALRGYREEIVPTLRTRSSTAAPVVP